MLILLAAVAVRVVATLTRSVIQFDETAYVRMAENLAAGRGLLDISGTTTTHFTPLLPLMIAALAAVLGDYVASGYLVVIVFGSLMLIPTYLLGKEMAGERAGLMAAALIAVSPIFVGTSEFIYTESIYIFFLLYSAFFVWRLLGRWRLRDGAGAGVCLGFAYLANPSAVFYLGAFIILFALVAWLRGRQKGTPAEELKLALRGSVLSVVLFFVVAAPYIVYLHSELGVWTFSGKESFSHNNFAATHNLRRDDVVAWERATMALDESGREVVAVSIEKVGMVGFVTNHPVGAAKIFVRQTYDFYSKVLHQLLPLWLLPLLGLGLFAGGWDRRRLVRIGFMLLLMSPALVVLAMYAHPRFFMPFIPVAMIWVAQGWQRLEDWGRGSIESSFVDSSRAAALKRSVPWVIGAAVLLPVFMMAAATTLRQDYPVNYKEAGLWLKAETGGGVDMKVMSREFSAAYYAGGTAVPAPYADYDSTTAFARAKDVAYLVISAGDISRLRPGLERLLEDPSRHPEWELVNRIRPGTDKETRVFKLN